MLDRGRSETLLASSSFCVSEAILLRDYAILNILVVYNFHLVLTDQMRQIPVLDTVPYM